MINSTNILLKSGPSKRNQLIQLTKLSLILILQPPVRHHSISLTNKDNIEKIIRNLRPKSSAGSDNISTKLLKEIENVVSRPLSIIINQSLCTGIFPDKLKIAKVIPLYKKDDNKPFGNYRPISLLSSISKIFEMVAFNQLYDCLTSNGLLYESQYGFRNFTRLN